MNTSHLRDTWAEHVEAQHRRLCHCIADLRQAFETTTADSAGAREVRLKLAALRDELQEHFALEEEGGFLEEAIARLPAISRDADQLLAEHPRLAAELAAILDRLHMDAANAEKWEQRRAEFVRLAEAMTAHECRENWLLKQGFNQVTEADLDE